MSSTGLVASASPPVAAGWSRWRVALIRLWAGLLTAYALVMASGVVQIAAAGRGERFMYASSTVWKMLSLGGVAFVMWTGGRSVAAYWAIATGQLIWIITGVLRPQPDGNGIALTLVNLVIFYGPLIALRPCRRELLRPHFRPSTVLLAIALAGCVPLAGFAIHLSRTMHGEIGFDMVGLYLILPVMALFAALRPAGGQLAAPLVAAGTVLVGIAAIIFPHDQASAGLLGGALLIAGGFAFVAVAHSSGRGKLVARPSSSPSQPASP